MEYDAVHFSPLLHSNEFHDISLYLIHTNRAKSSLLPEKDTDCISSLYLKANIVLKLLILSVKPRYTVSIDQHKIKTGKKNHVSTRTYYKLLLVYFLCSIRGEEPAEINRCIFHNIPILEKEMLFIMC